jgi:hypothetical protein
MHASGGLHDYNPYDLNLDRLALIIVIQINSARNH